MPRKKKTSGRAIATVNPSTNLPALPERFAIGGTEVRPVQLFTNPHRHPGGPGPWEEEPDKLAWIHAKTGKHCILLRQPSGAWSGFVGIDPDLFRALNAVRIRSISIPTAVGSSTVS